MKFFLTLYICSQISGICAVPPGYPKPTEDYYTCTKEGIGESYEILFGGKMFTRDTIVVHRLYSRYTCDKVVIPEKKSDPKQPTIEKGI